MDICNEIKLVKFKPLTAIKSYGGTSSKSYRINMDDIEEFTIHKHNIHSTLYPSYNINSPKYKRIKDFLLSKGVPFKEFSNISPGGWNAGGWNERKIINLRIPNQHILFLDKPINEI